MSVKCTETICYYQGHDGGGGGGEESEDSNWFCDCLISEGVYDGKVLVRLVVFCLDSQASITVPLHYPVLCHPHPHK